jgi:hypothetical protein
MINNNYNEIDFGNHYDFIGEGTFEAGENGSDVINSVVKMNFGGYKVEEDAFKGSGKNLQSLTIGEEVTGGESENRIAIGINAFGDCENLEYFGINGDTRIEYISKNAFKNSKKLNKKSRIGINKMNLRRQGNKGFFAS